MAISCFFGRTESGKSFRANLESKKYKKAFLYDNTHCFKDGVIINDFSAENLSRVFQKYANMSEFRLIFRPPFHISEKDGAEIVAKFIYRGFGLYWKQRGIDLNKPENRVCFLVDEADKVSAIKKDSIFYLVVTKGRHFGIDTFAISQGPGKIPLYYRENASEIFCFKMRPHDYLVETFGREIAEKIQTLPNYHYAYFKDTGETKFFNEKGKAYGK